MSVFTVKQQMLVDTAVQEGARRATSELKRAVISLGEAAEERSAGSDYKQFWQGYNRGLRDIYTMIERAERTLNND